MIDRSLAPTIDVLTKEYVLIQAWKKTASYIRYHNWYSDTLELDRISANLPDFIQDLSAQLRDHGTWRSDALRFVPAPKSQEWVVDSNTKTWRPSNPDETKSKIRPLAHVTVRDQVAATAIALCIANRVETAQGDPRDSIGSSEKRRKSLSYGNRLFCDEIEGGLQHRWGSGKFYREYYQDYRSFLSRPELVVKQLQIKPGDRAVIVHSDLRQFFDRVTPDILHAKLSALQQPIDDPAFYALTKNVLNWTWHASDAPAVSWYASTAELGDFSTIGLPQGLVASGFLSNIALLDFDSAVQHHVGAEIYDGIVLEDACRYVDDLRFVVTTAPKLGIDEVRDKVFSWLETLLSSTAPGTLPSQKKTKAATYSGGERPLVQQSRKMQRIQGSISGGFDANSGLEILDAIQGLIRSQERFSESNALNDAWSLSPIPDVRDTTVARFAAARFRSTFRSLRPLLIDAGDLAKDATINIREHVDPSAIRTRTDLDSDAQAFALGMIEQWVADPSNVRLLRIGLDLWPSCDVLINVLNLLRPYTTPSTDPTPEQAIAWYCVAEIFRAGATETGFAEDAECLPSSLNIEAYRSVLLKEAKRLLEQSKAPWYVQQQMLLYCAATGEYDVWPPKEKGMRHYKELLQFLRGFHSLLSSTAFATWAVVARKSFLNITQCAQLVAGSISPARIEKIAKLDPTFARDLLGNNEGLIKSLPSQIKEDLCYSDRIVPSLQSLNRIVLWHGPNGPLRNEIQLLRFANAFLVAIQDIPLDIITPGSIHINLESISSDFSIKLLPRRGSAEGSFYEPPSWASKEERWRFQLGFLLRFILTCQCDFTTAISGPQWRESTAIYRRPSNHWYQRIYGLFNGHSGFGDDWVPISDWVERFLSALLAWPGVRHTKTMDIVADGIEPTKRYIRERLDQLLKLKGNNDLILLPISAPWQATAEKNRPLRACVVQTVIPSPESHIHLDDLTLSKREIRRKHRNHLSMALAAIERMIDLRETHKGRDGRLDWLILPELSVHPADVKTHLVPFARKHRTIILAGLTYQQLIHGEPLSNSAIWIIPVWSEANGLQVLERRQGKQHLSPEEELLNSPDQLVKGFRPCQWLVGYRWSSEHTHTPLQLTAAICYDATDISLVAQISRYSDVFAIPALNKDVGTFDQMASALHYHMFQMVVIANNGEYGGSNAYAPYKETFKKQIFHLHGQPQATVAFLEIDDIAGFLQRVKDAKAKRPPTPKATTGKDWKYPPAGF